MKGTFLNNSLKTFITSLIVLIIGVIISSIIARSLGPEGRGNYAIIIQSITILIAFGQFGLVDVMLSQVKNKDYLFKALAGNSMLFIFLSTIFIAFLLWITFYTFSSKIYNSFNPKLLFFAFFIAPSNFIIIFFNRIIQLKGYIKFYNRISLIRQFFWLLSILLWIIFWDNTLEAVLFGLVSAQFIVAVYIIYLVNSFLKIRTWYIDKNLLLKSLGGGIKLSLGMAFTLLGQQVGLFILSYYMEASEVGWYAIALGLSSMLFMVATSIKTVLESWIGSINKSLDNIADRTIIITRQLFILYIPLCLLLILFGKQAILIIYGSSFLPAYGPMIILQIFILLRVIDKIISSHLTYIKHFWVLTISATLGMITSLLLSIVLVQPFGIIGVSIATVFGQLVATAIVCLSFIRNSNYGIIDFIPQKGDYILYKTQFSNFYNRLSK